MSNIDSDKISEKIFEVRNYNKYIECRLGELKDVMKNNLQIEINDPNNFEKIIQIEHEYRHCLDDIRDIRRWSQLLGEIYIFFYDDQRYFQLSEKINFIYDHLVRSLLDIQDVYRDIIDRLYKGVWITEEYIKKLENYSRDCEWLLQRVVELCRVTDQMIQQYEDENQPKESDKFVEEYRLTNERIVKL